MIWKMKQAIRAHSRGMIIKILIEAFVQISVIVGE